MKQIIIVFLIFILLSGIGNAEDNYNVTWTPISESIINKEYIITIQNLQIINKNVNIKSFFDETNFNINKLKDIEFYEWKLIPYTYTIDHYDETSYLEFDSVNGTWYNVEESVFNYTETVESEKLDWKKCKSQLFVSTAHTIKDDYGLITIPKLGSKDTGKGTYNGTKRFLLKFKTPITGMESSYGSSGKVAVFLDDVEYHPYWNTSWSTRKIITLTGNTSGAQTDYQILLNITYESGMQSDFDDLRFTNDTHELDSWLESKVDGSYALVWVEFPTTPANGVAQDYWMYYGNAGAASDWDGAATFLQYHGYDTGNFIDSLTVPYNNIIYESQVQFTSAGHNVNFGLGMSNADKPYPDYADIKSYTPTNTFFTRTSRDSVESYQTPTPCASINTDHKIKIIVTSSGATYFLDIVQQGTEITTTMPDSNMGLYSYHTIGTAYQNWSFARKYAANPPTHTFGSTHYCAGSVHYNTTSPYNHTIESDGTITANRSITAADNINWTAATVSADCQLLVTEYNLANTTIANFTLYTASLDWLKITNLTVGETYNLTNSTTYEQQTADASGEANFTTDLIAGDYQISHDITPPASITGLTNTTGNFYHNWTWTNPTDADFNYTIIYINGLHITNTSNEYYNLSADAHNQSIISTHTVDTTGNVNNTWVNHTSIIPNNPITITNTSDWFGNIGETVYVNYNAVDADLDTPAYSCNRSDLFADFDTVTGKGNWTITENGTRYVNFGVSDGWGACSNYTMEIQVGILPPPTNVQSFIDETVLMFTILKSELIGVKNNVSDYLLYAFIFGGVILIFVIIKLLISIISKGYRI